MNDKSVFTAAEATLAACSEHDLLEEVGRRFRIRYGVLEVTYHDGCPNPRVTIEYRKQRDLDQK